MCFRSKTDPQTKKSQELDLELKKAQRAFKNEHKILLLGPGESGKSTIFKQMKLMQSAEQGAQGYTLDERMSFRKDIYNNCLQQIRILLRGAANAGFRFDSEDRFKAASQLLQENPPTNGSVEWSTDIGNLIKLVWADPKLKAFYLNHDDKVFQTNDTAHYFFEHVGRLADPNYTPEVEDILHVRVRTTGIQEATFKFLDGQFKVVDVGGQRSERRKWIHCFNEVTCVIFCASLSDYDQTLREERTVNRLDEAIELFDDVINSNCFGKNTTIMLFLNKIDLFKEKIKRIPLKVRFEAYQGGPDYDLATKFIASRFLERKNSVETSVQVMLTCAVDTEHIRAVIDGVKRKILENFTREFVL